MNTSRWWLVLLIAAAAVTAVLRGLMISVPFERDEGGYAYIADRWLGGETPYLEVVDSKPPGVFFVYAVVLALWRSVAAIRLALLLWSFFTAWLFYRLAAGAFGPRAGALAAALLLLTQAAPAYFGFSANAEIFMVTFVIAALLIVWTRIDGRRSFAAGVLLGAAVLFKPVALADGLPLAVLLLWRAEGWRKKIVSLLWAGLGFLIVLAAAWGFFALLGAGKPMLFWAYLYNFSYAGDLPWDERIFNLFYQIQLRGMLARDWPLWVAAVIGLVSLLRRRPSWAHALFPLAWLVSAFVGVSASGRFTPHYWQQLLPPLCLLAAAGADRLWQAMSAKTISPVLKRAAQFILLAVLLAYPTASQARLAALGPQLSRELYGLNPFMEGEQIGRYLADHTDPAETIYIVGSEPQFLFHARRRHASKIIFFAPLTGRHPDCLALQQEVWAEVEKAAPRYIVRLNISSSLVLEDDTPPFLFEHLNALLAAKYAREAALVAVSPAQTQLLTENLPPEGQGPIILDIYRRRD